MKAAFRLLDLHRRVAPGLLLASAVVAAPSVRSEGRESSRAMITPHAYQPQLPPQWRGRAQESPLPRFADERKLYCVDSIIGRGGFGLVHQGRDKESDVPVAIKRVCKQTTSKAKFLQEVEILRAVSGHHNVVTLCEAFETNDAYVLVTELVNGEELFDQLIHNGVFSERRAQALVREVAGTLAYLHANGVVHGDLKPENILVSNDASNMRLIDFGQSFREHISSERMRCLGGGVATIAYAAPEVISATTSKVSRASSQTGSAIDLWGLGVLLYILLCGFHPFDPENDATDAELAKRITDGAFDAQSPEWTELPAAAKSLIESLLQVDPTRRVSAQEVLAHEWLAAAQPVV